MEGKRRGETYHAFRDTLSSFCKAVVGINLCIGKLIEAPRKPDNLVIPEHPADRCGSDAGGLELGKSDDPLSLQKLASQIALGARS
jgi:hypothetical protein